MIYFIGNGGKYMPKLKEDSLKKRHVCHYCGKSFPTKQGLAGHIQFKHQKKFIKEPDLPPYFEIAKKLKTIELSGFTTIPFDDTLDMIKFWTEFQTLSSAFNIELTQQDLKNYVIANLVQIYHNQRLKDKIIKALVSITGK
jgi:uncharacterized Zn-finger protein